LGRPAISNPRQVRKPAWHTLRAAMNARDEVVFHRMKSVACDPAASAEGSGEWSARDSGHDSPIPEQSAALKTLIVRAL